MDKAMNSCGLMTNLNKQKMTKKQIDFIVEEIRKIGIVLKSEQDKNKALTLENKKLIEQLRIGGVNNSANANKPKLSVKCLHCGRKFISKMPHKCDTGFRKRNHSWQEITED